MDKDLQKYIGEIISKRKDELKVSRYELGRMSGISYVQLMNIEKGESTTTRILGKILDALDLELIIKPKR